jgi:hypothetical protein
VALGPVFKSTGTAIVNRIVLFYFRLISPLIEYFKIYRAFPVYLTRPGFVNACGYFSSFCDILALNMAQSRGEFNDPERLKAFYGHYPAQSSVY